MACHFQRYDKRKAFRIKVKWDSVQMCYDIFGRKSSVSTERAGLDRDRLPLIARVHRQLLIKCFIVFRAYLVVTPLRCSDFSHIIIRPGLTRVASGIEKGKNFRTRSIREPIIPNSCLTEGPKGRLCKQPVPASCLSLSTVRLSYHVVLHQGK